MHGASRGVPDHVGTFWQHALMQSAQHATSDSSPTWRTLPARTEHWTGAVRALCSAHCCAADKPSRRASESAHRTSGLLCGYYCRLCCERDDNRLHGSRLDAVRARFLSQHARPSLQGTPPRNNRSPNVLMKRELLPIIAFGIVLLPCTPPENFHYVSRWLAGCSCRELEPSRFEMPTLLRANSGEHSAQRSISRW